MITLEGSMPRLARAFTPEELRNEYLVSGLFQAGRCELRWWETDRTVMGGLCPGVVEMQLPLPAELRSEFFFERREGGFVNIGGPGRITVDGTVHHLDELDALYVGRGAKAVSLASDSAENPMRCWLLSYPAHAAYPTRKVAFKEVQGDKLGGRDNANERILTKLIHPGAFPTCQLVMGVTQLQPGSVWNTMPPHTHLRRSEVYLYFRVKPDQAVFHFMGKPAETRHLVVRDCEAVLSPPWSIHSGAGTSNYSFIWGMGGENQAFADMDPAPVSQLK